MENREKVIIKTESKLQGINSIEEFKANEKEILDLLDMYIKSGIDSLDDFLENMYSMNPEEREEKAKLFQDENFPFEPRIEKEMKRLDTLPGFFEYAEDFGTKMDKLMEPRMQQYSVLMEKLMETMMGGVKEAMEGMMEGISQAFAQEEEVVEENWEFDYDNPDTPAMLYSLYASRTPEELKENMENIIESLDEQIQSDIWDLEVLTEMPTEDLFESDFEKIGDIRKRMERLEPEMEKEFARISLLPNSTEVVDKVRGEINNRLIRKIRMLKGYLRRTDKWQIEF